MIASAASPCDATIPGLWYCGGIPSCLGDVYSAVWNASRGPGAITVHPVAGTPGWHTMQGQFSADFSSLDAVYADIGVNETGAVFPNCSLILYARDNSTWSSQPPPPVGGKLRVHMVPHTHDDVGWDATLLQYYQGGVIPGFNVSQILDAVVAGLLLDPRRKFTYVEMAFFFGQWWPAQPPAVQAQVRGLVASGQLTFANGGYSMHDEANPTYIDLLDNTALGNRYIRDAFNASALPTVTWQIDPFGHSAFQGVLSSPLAGFQGVLWAREPEDYKELCFANQSLERIWLPSPSLGLAAASWQAIFHDFYSTPNEVNRCGFYASTPPTSLQCNYSWAAVDAPALKADILRRAKDFRGNDVLILFGSDFQWPNALVYFDYVDGLIDALNAESAQFEAFYSTPAAYVQAKLASVPSFPPRAGDYFPYTSDSAGHQVWSGYFTSRPAFKGFVRESSAILQAARQLQALVGGVADLGPDNPLYELERAMGVAQHHDAISGTAKQNVDFDYEKMLEGGRQAAFASIAASFSTASGFSGNFSLCPLANVSLCPALEAGSGAVVALLYNALGQSADASPVRLPVAFPPGVASYAVVDAGGSNVTAQLVPLSARDAALRALYNGSAAAPLQWLCFTAALPAAGYAAVFITPVAAAADAPATHASVLTVLPRAPRAADATISNGRLTLSIGAASGFLSRYADAETGIDLALAQTWASYVGASGASINGSSQASGAYVFRPAAEDAAPQQAAAAAVTLITGPVLNAARSDGYAFVSVESRLWAGADHAEIEWTVGPVDVSSGGREVITRYSSADIPSAARWFTDANCRDAQLRQRNARAQWDIHPSEAVSSNYYPVNCITRLSGGGATLAIAVDRSQGGTSLHDGELELLVHRRLLVDDGFGVGEPLNEPGLDGKGLIIRGRHWLLVAPTAAAPPMYKRLLSTSLARPTLAAAFAPLGSGVSPAQWCARYAATRSLLAAPLPANIHLATVQVQSGSAALLRLAHIYDAGEDAEGSANATLSLAALFAPPLAVRSAQDMTLQGSQPLAAVAHTTYTLDGGENVTAPVLPQPPAGATLDIVLGPQEIRTLEIGFFRNKREELAPKEHEI